MNFPKIYHKLEGGEKQSDVTPVGMISNQQQPTESKPVDWKFWKQNPLTQSFINKLKEREAELYQSTLNHSSVLSKPDNEIRLGVMRLWAIHEVITMIEALDKE